MDSKTVKTEYERRLQAHGAEAARRARQSAWIGNLRLAAALGVIAVIWGSAKTHAFAVWWFAAPLAVFAALVIVHERVIRAEGLAKKAEGVYRRGLGRIEDKWAGSGNAGEHLRPEEHVFAEDLDLFGRGSLFELLCTARTPQGEQLLARWLLEPGRREEIAQRQEAVAELREKVEFREELATRGEDLSAPRDAEALAKWAEAAPVLQSPTLRVLATVLGMAGMAAIVTAFTLGWWLALLVVVAVEGSLAYRLRRATEQVIAGVEGAAPELALIAALLRRIEEEPAAAARLKAVLERAKSGGATAWACLARLRTIADFIDGRHNMLVRALDTPMMYTVQVAFAAEAWRRRHGKTLRRWLEAVAEYEALASVATYAYEHPGDPFPEVEAGASPRFEGEEMGHPLIPEKQCVRNSVSLGEGTRLLVVSGSNMSGKSTLLRAMGTNVVLAGVGAPVRARRVRLSEMRLGTAIRVTDSLQAGKSGFYAEITRLRQIMDLANGEEPVLFLCDELLHGTNSHDRRIGAEALLKALLERGAMGVVTTHDLALTEIAASDGRVRNAHFEDQVVEGKMVFDYRLRDGVVTKSNALELMRSVGLGIG